MKILNDIKKTTAYQVFIYSKEWKKTGLIILMDIFFFSLLFAAAKIFDYAFTQNEALVTGTWIGYILLLVYFLSIIAVYSFFKYCIIQFLNNNKIEAKINAKELGKFYVYNCISLFILLTAFISLTTFFTVSLISILKQAALVIFLIVFISASYYFMTVSHILFKKYPLKELPPKVYETVHWKFIAQWIGWNILFVFTFFIIYLFLFMILQMSGTTLTLFYVLNLLMFIIITIQAYVLLYWNRLYLFLKINTKP
ncbi:MAG: hypothetical protein WC254_01145 [Candidatus Woesearchaeota archaeon]|jgi:hypothetical protein